MKGYSDGSNRFGPDDSITRAMAVTVLWRMAGGSACEAPDFDDADYSEESWYKDAVRWARASEVVKGYEGTNYFGPNDPVTREQLAVMVARFASTISHIDTSSTGAALAAKPDAASVSDWARDAVAWSVDQGILGGASIIDPQGPPLAAKGARCSPSRTRSSATKARAMGKPASTSSTLGRATASSSSCRTARRCS